MCSINHSPADSSETITETFDWDERESVQTAVVHTIAAVTNQDPVEMEPLSHFIDPDSLDALFAPTRRSPRNSGSVEFQYQDCTVRVSAEGTVSVTYLGE
jgi:hypothetical protein